jgi:hypothetical protein
VIEKKNPSVQSIIGAMQNNLPECETTPLTAIAFSNSAKLLIITAAPFFVMRIAVRNRNAPHS